MVFSGWTPQPTPPDPCLALQDLPWNCSLLVEGHNWGLSLCPVSVPSCVLPTTQVPALPLGSPRPSEVDGIKRCGTVEESESPLGLNCLASLRGTGGGAPQARGHAGKLHSMRWQPWPQFPHLYDTRRGQATFEVPLTKTAYDSTVSSPFLSAIHPLTSRGSPHLFPASAELGLGGWPRVRKTSY